MCKNKDIKKILIIDDLEDNRVILKTYLKKLEIPVHEADNGPAGIDAYKHYNH